jgi:hypothetical protein
MTDHTENPGGYEPEDIKHNPENDYDATVTPRHVEAAEKTLSPKLLAGAATGLVLAIVVAVFGAVTPDMLAGLGAWAPLAFVAITTAATQLAVYIKRDPLREV